MIHNNGSITFTYFLLDVHDPSVKIKDFETEIKTVKSKSTLDVTLLLTLLLLKWFRLYFGLMQTFRIQMSLLQPFETTMATSCCNIE